MGRVQDSLWWMAVPGARWRSPYGSDSSIKEMEEMPVVHVSHKDAVAYCDWADRRLPTELEWEYAAWGGVDPELLKEEDVVDGRVPKSWGAINAWSGEFPPKEGVKPGASLGTAISQQANGADIHNMLGNVWEWCDGGPGKLQPIRGGSFIDTLNGSFNHRILPHTRMANPPDSTSSNTGFRCASSVRAPQYPPEPATGTGTAATNKERLQSMDQSVMQQIVAEGGVEALQDYLTNSGVEAQVMTPQQLEAQRERVRQNRPEL